MAQRPTRQWLRLSCILMAGLASAKSLTLSDFESIESKQVSTDCIRAYDTPLSGCTSNDFTGGKACSAGCKVSIKETENYIKASCSGIDSDSDSLLYRGQNNNLVEVLCRDVDEIRTQTQASTLSTQVKENLMIETTAAPQTPSGGLRSDTPEEDEDDEVTVTSVLAVDLEKPTQSLPTSIKIPTATSTKAAAEEDSSSQRTSQPGGGGGDPGDFITSTGSSHLPALSLISAMLCVVFVA